MKLKKFVMFGLTLTLGLMIIILIAGLLLPEKLLLKLSGAEAKQQLQTASELQSSSDGTADGETPTTQNSSNAPNATAANPASNQTASTNVATNQAGSQTTQANSPAGTTSGSASQVAPTLTFSVSPSSISAGGSAVLSWSISSNATQPVSCTANNGWSGTKATSGSQSVAPASTTSYSLACTNSAGTSGSKTVNVTVSAPVSACKAGGTCSASDVAAHNTNGNCWVGVTGTGFNKVYVITSSFNSSHLSTAGKNAASSIRTCGKVISIGTLRGFAGDHTSGASIGGQNFSSWLNSFYYANYQ